MELGMTFKVMQAPKTSLAYVAEEWLLLRMGKKVRLEVVVPGKSLIAMRTSMLASGTSRRCGRGTEWCCWRGSTKSWGGRRSGGELFGYTAGSHLLNRRYCLVRLIGIVVRLK
jgi:hypothetical protein